MTTPRSVPWTDLLRKQRRPRPRRYLRSIDQLWAVMQRVADGATLPEVAEDMGYRNVSGFHHLLSRRFYPEVGARGLMHAIAIGFREGKLK